MIHTSSYEISITESTEVGAARRMISFQAEKRGYSENEVGKIALVINELGTNLIKHTDHKGGALIVQFFEQPKRVQIFSLDQGPGIQSISQSLMDGFSSTSTRGEGLGAVKRLSSSFDVFSEYGKGAAVFVEIAPSDQDLSQTSMRTDLRGGISVNYPGEPVCGDGWHIEVDERSTTVLLSDGLGHGPSAHDVSEKAREVFQEHRSKSLTEIMTILNMILRGTRGGAVSMARIFPAQNQVDFIGLGNVVGGVVTGTQTSSLVSMNGIVGGELHKLKQFSYPYGDRSVLILFSDGLSTRTSLQNYSGLLQKPAPLIAAVLYRDFTRHRDDSSVVVIKGSAWERD